MHRTNHVPRLFGWWSLLAGLLLHIGASAASTQEVQPIQLRQGPTDRLDVPVVMMTVGTTQPYRISSKEPLKRVENPNPKVLNVQRIGTDLDKVLFDAVGPGRTRVTFTDQKDRVEVVDVVVISDRVKELRDLLQRSIPTGAVTVSSTDSGNNIILAGTVLSTEDAKAVQQIAAQLFGANVINNVRIGGVQQVQLEVVIAVVNRSEVRNMAFSFTEGRAQGFVSSLFTNPIAAAANIATSVPASVANASVTGGNVAFGVLGRQNSFFGVLQALRTESLAKILAEPRILTLSGRPAKIQSGGNVKIISGGTSSASLDADFGTIVTFLPIVLGNGKIHLEVSSELSTPTTSIPIPGAGAVGSTVVSFSVLKRSTQVAVQIEDGQTLAIGGLIQNTIDSSIQRIPLLGDIPFLGVLFTQKSYSESEEEFLVLVTPRLVDPIDCTKIPHYLPGRETRSPDDFEWFLEGILEAPRGQRNMPLLHYKPAYLSPGGGPLPCNDASGCYRRYNGDNGACEAPSTYPIISGNGINGNGINGNGINGNGINGNGANRNGVNGNGVNGANRNGGNGVNGASFNGNGINGNGINGNGINGNGGIAPPNMIPAPPSRPLAPLPTIKNVKFQTDQENPFPSPPMRESAPNFGPSFPAPMPPLPAMPPLSWMPPLPMIPMAAARELENRPVLPPVSFGTAVADNNKTK